MMKLLNLETTRAGRSPILKQCAFLLGCLLLMIGTAFGGKPSSLLPAEIVFHDLLGDRIQSDQDQIYGYGSSYEHGTDWQGIPIRVRVASESGGLDFATFRSNHPKDTWEGRPLSYDFSEMVAGPDDPTRALAVIPPSPHGTAVQWLLRIPNVTGGLLGMVHGTTEAGNLTVNFRYQDDPPNSLYSIRFHSNYPPSDQVAVTCTRAAADGSCDQWNIEAESLGPDGCGATARLLSEGSSIHEGDFCMPFSATLTLLADTSDGGGNGGGKGGGKGKNK